MPGLGHQARPRQVCSIEMGEHLNRQLYRQPVDKVDPADLGGTCVEDLVASGGDHVHIQITGYGVGAGDSNTDATLAVVLGRVESQAFVLWQRRSAMALRVYGRKHVVLPGLYCRPRAGASAPWYNRRIAAHAGPGDSVLQVVLLLLRM